MASLRLGSVLMVLMTFVACGSRLPTGIISDPLGSRVTPDTGGEENKTFLDYAFQSVDGEVTEFKSIHKPLVVIFSNYSCGSCREETAAIVSSLKFPDANPSQVSVFTLMIGDDQESAKRFREQLRIPWPVGQDVKFKLFKEHCPERTTPCMLVQNPTKGLVIQKNGPVPMEEVLEVTGSWEVEP